MKIETKIGDRWRILIPQKMREEMKLIPGQKLTMESFPDRNEIILLFNKNDSESNLGDQKDDKEYPLR